MIPKNRPPTHPGVILLEEFLRPAGISQVKLSRDLKIPFQRVNTIIAGKRGVTAETAWLLAGYFKTTPEFWMNLQDGYDLYQARRFLGESRLAQVSHISRSSVAF